MATHNVLVIGTNRGLGLGLLKVFKESGYNVFSTLEATGATIIDLDYLDEESIAAAAQSYGNDRALDVLVNCGGVEMYPEKWLDTTAESLIYKYCVMTVGPFLASKYLLLSLKKSEFGKIVNITSEWASIAANDCGIYISYRVPKSALNALSISVAIELRAAKENIAVLCVDPGDVLTKLSRWAGDVDLNDSVCGMYEQIEKATIEDTGLFVNWRGYKWPY